MRVRVWKQQAVPGLVWSGGSGSAVWIRPAAASYSFYHACVTDGDDDGGGGWHVLTLMRIARKAKQSKAKKRLTLTTDQ
jgi:hypothetical protein